MQDAIRQSECVVEPIVEAHLGDQTTGFYLAEAPNTSTMTAHQRAMATSEMVEAACPRRSSIRLRRDESDQLSVPFRMG